MAGSWAALESSVGCAEGTGMNWFTALLITGYIGVCEARVPSPFQACESRWNWALGVLVPSPIQGAIPAVSNLLRGRRRHDESIELQQDRTPDP